MLPGNPSLGLPHHQGHIWKAMTQSTELDCQYMHGRTSGLNLGRFVSVCRAASESRKPAELLTLLPRLKHRVVSCTRWQPRRQTQGTCWWHRDNSSATTSHLLRTIHCLSDLALETTLRKEQDGSSLASTELPRCRAMSIRLGFE